MTKGDLIRQINDYPDDINIVIGIPVKGSTEVEYYEAPSVDHSFIMSDAVIIEIGKILC